MSETRAKIREENDTMKIRPLQDRVLVQRTEGEEKTAGGIIIPDTAKEKPQEGIVIATGKGKPREDGGITPLDVAEGDRVLFGKYSGSDVRLDGEDYVILREDDVLAVLDSSKKKGK
jgi:chaperonin GroES